MAALDKTLEAAAPLEEANETAEAPSMEQRGKKRKVALYVAYNGVGYHGMQANPGYQTIESELEAAICRAGGISAQNSGDFSKSNWMRCARTDKGVSAVGQLVSLKLIITGPEIVDRINAELPPQIRVLGYTRVINSFDARHQCDRRRYEYILPAYAFDPKACRERAAVWKEGQAKVNNQPSIAAATPPSVEAPGAATSVTLAEKQSDGHTGAPHAELQSSNAGASRAESHSLPGSAGDPATSDTSLQAAREPDQLSQIGSASAVPEQVDKGSATAAAGQAANDVSCEAAAAAGSFEFDDACRARLNEVLQQFEGTHNFHNFTVKVPASDPSAKRYILKFSCPGTVLIEGQPWVRLVVTGQSFMLHQIRKMVAVAVAVMRGVAPDNAISLCLDPRRKINTPIAPELGLFLDESIFSSYNARWGEERGECISLDGFKEQVANFKAKYLYPQIAARDAEEEISAGFLRSLNDKNYGFSTWEGLPLHTVGKKKQPKQMGRTQGAAALVGSQETYGLPHSRGARSPRGDKRKWEGPPQPADEDEIKVHKVDGSSVTAGEGVVHTIPDRRETRDVAASLDAEWSD